MRIKRIKLWLPLALILAFGGYVVLSPSAQVLTGSGGGPTGPTGAAGPTGATGATGAIGSSVVASDFTVNSSANTYASATADIGSGPDGVITTTLGAGAAGLSTFSGFGGPRYWDIPDPNAAFIRVIVPAGSDTAMTVTFDGPSLTITVSLGKTAGVVDPTKNVANDVAAAINGLFSIAGPGRAVNIQNAVASGTGLTPLSVAEGPTAFTGGTAIVPINTITIPANTLNGNGDQLLVTAMLRMVTSSTSVFYLSFGNQIVFPDNSSQDIHGPPTDIMARLTLFRISAGVQRGIGNVAAGSAQGGTPSAVFASGFDTQQDETQPIAVRVYGLAASPGDFEGHGMVAAVSKP